MTDASLTWSNSLCEADLSLDYDLATDAGLRTAILISLFTDRRAQADDTLPQEGGDRRGWWGDSYADEDGDQIGSRLWLLAREKQLATVLDRARQYASESLNWLIKDGVASAVDITAEVTRPGMLGLQVVVTRPAGPARSKYDFVWKGV